MARKAQFTRPEPGFSLYEGRTRGKRIKYTFSDEEDGASDAVSTRRSNRQSGLSTPAEPARPTVTASGRHVKSRYGGAYGETMPSSHHDHDQAPSVNGLDGTEDDEEVQASTLRSGRATCNRGRRERRHADDTDSIDCMDDESDPTSSGHEWNGDDDDEADEHANDGEDEEEMSDDISEDELAIDEDPRLQRSLVVSLRYPKPTPPSMSAAPKGLSITVEPNGISDQAPPPEANPFAAPFNTDATMPESASGYTPLMNDTTMNTGQIQETQVPPALPPGGSQFSV